VYTVGADGLMNASSAISNVMKDAIERNDNAFGFIVILV